MSEQRVPIDVILPDDLAKMLGDIATEPISTRSTVLSLIVDAASDASVVISLLQGPPALDYWVVVTKNWLDKRRQRGIGELRLKGPGGEATFVVTEDTDLGELAATLHKYMFPRRQRNMRDIDDIAT